MQAERKSSTSTHIPDLDNANVGTYMIITRDTLVSLFFIHRQNLKGSDLEFINLPLNLIRPIESELSS